MKKILTIITLLSIVICLSAQDIKYLFTYDNAGNRLGASITLKSAKLSALDSTLNEEYNTQFKDLKIKLYPNPTKGLIQIEIPQYNSDMDIDVYLIDSSGKNLYFDKKISAQCQLNLSEFSAGIYFLKLVYKKESRVLKVIKQ